MTALLCLLFTMPVAGVPTALDTPAAPAPTATTVAGLPVLAGAGSIPTGGPDAPASKEMAAVAAGVGAAAGAALGLAGGGATVWVLFASGGQGVAPWGAGAVVLLGGAAVGGLVGVGAVDRPDAVLGATVGATVGVIGGGLAGVGFGLSQSQPSGYPSLELALITGIGGCVSGAALGAVVGVAIGAEASPQPPWQVFTLPSSEPYRWRY